MFQTQTIRPSDFSQGRIRFPEEARPQLPKEKGEVSVIIKGKSLMLPFDPNMRADRPRSPFLIVSKKMLPEFVSLGDVLKARFDNHGTPWLT